MGSGWDKLLLALRDHLRRRLGAHHAAAADPPDALDGGPQGLPKIFGKVHPKYMTPFKGTIILTVLSILWYVLLTWTNDNLL